MNLIITGGCGFLGSHLAEYFVSNKQFREVILLDKFGYCTASMWAQEFVETKENARIVRDDLSSSAVLEQFVQDGDVVIHCAAESHVARSFSDPSYFFDANVIGANSVASVCRKRNLRLLINVSTDEVYGENLEGNPFDENTKMNPMNPYSRSKAASECVFEMYAHEFNFRFITLRPNNLFGIRQFPEKLIPRSIARLINSKHIEIEGSGRHKRCYLAVGDLCSFIAILLESNIDEAVFNVGSVFEYSNLEIAQLLVECCEYPLQDPIRFVADRPHNDSRYLIDFSAARAVGWKPNISLEDYLAELLCWYIRNLGCTWENWRSAVGIED